jgi:predicted nuclease of predicted toxin-antitoxin system
MQLYADENFPLPVVEGLRRLGHDVLTVQEDGRQSKPDPDILTRAHGLGRAVLTHDRRDFERLHRQGADHSGILSATPDDDASALAARIDAKLAGRSPGRWCFRVNRPPRGSACAAWTSSKPGRMRRKPATGGAGRLGRWCRPR